MTGPTIANLDSDAPIYEAVVIGSDEATSHGSIDPIVTITINNGYHDYVFTPEQIDKIIVRKKQA